MYSVDFMHSGLCIVYNLFPPSAPLIIELWLLLFHLYIYRFSVMASTIRRERLDSMPNNLIEVTLCVCVFITRNVLQHLQFLFTHAKPLSNFSAHCNTSVMRGRMLMALKSYSPINRSIAFQ